MTEKKYDNQTALEIGMQLIALWKLNGLITAGLVCGSIRRNHALVKDIELVIAPAFGVDPHPTPTQMAMFGPNARNTEGPAVNLFECMLDEMMHITPMKMGSKDGPAQKEFIYEFPNNDVIKIDTFIVSDPRAWGVIVAIRTGPGLEFNKPLMKWINSKGMHTSEGLLHDHKKFWSYEKHNNRGQCQNKECHKIIPCKSEKDFFAAIGLPYINPPGRTTETLAVAIKLADKEKTHAR